MCYFLVTQFTSGPPGFLTLCLFLFLFCFFIAFFFNTRNQRKISQKINSWRKGPCKRGYIVAETLLHFNRPFARRGHVVQNPPCWMANNAVGHRKKTELTCEWLSSLYFMSHCTICHPAWRILYHVTKSCKGSICAHAKHLFLTHVLLGRNKHMFLIFFSETHFVFPTNVCPFCS